LIAGLEAVKLSQKVYEHTPQAKVLEFFVALFFPFAGNFAKS
jgi:hypothetical protein